MKGQISITGRVNQKVSVSGRGGGGEVWLPLGVGEFFPFVSVALREAFTAFPFPPTAASSLSSYFTLHEMNKFHIHGHFHRW